MKGVILAGGKGTRLLPATRVINKHMVPILNRPMITYPVETLKALGVRDILVVSGGNHIGGIAEFLGDGSDFGVNFTYKVQKDAGGIAQALGIARDFAAGQSIAVILGDNVFDNAVFAQFPGLDDGKPHIFVKEVPDMRRFGVAYFKDGKYAIVEKPEVVPEGGRAVTGIYVYPPEVFDIVGTLKPSARGELEITDVNNAFIELGECRGHDLGGAFWSDAGTPESLYEVTKWAYEQK